MQAPFFTFCHLHRLCKHHFLCFAICISYASIKTLVFTFAERRYVLENGRGGACVPARTSAQWRFHTKNTHIMRGDERWMRPCRATRAGTQAPPLPISIMPFCTIPLNGIIHPCVIHPNEMRRGGACVPARTSAQRRFHTKNTRIVHEDLTVDAPLQGDTGGHTGTAPTKLHHAFLHHSIKRNHPSTCNPPITNGHFGHVPAKLFII